MTLRDFRAALRSGLAFFILMSGCFFVLQVPTASATGDYSRLLIPQVKYRGGNYKPRPKAVESLLGLTSRRTSVEVRRVPMDIDLKRPDLYKYPFLYLAGDKGFDAFPESDLKILRNFLSYGGFLLIDDNSSEIHSSFDTSVRQLISDLFPNVPLQKIPRDHSIYRSFYLIDRPVGRKVVNPFLEGITLKGRTVLVYSTNDLGGAWARNKLGHWQYDILGGGLHQRKMAVRLGINLVMYALTLDYKKDMVHLPIILERLRRSR